MGFIFLRAQWNNLIMANYKIDPAILKAHLPKYTELDYYNGKAYISLVGFMFKNTRILGMKIPFHINFEEVNLRFYVRHNDNGEWKRGVVFIKEIVPRSAITYVANNFYHEKYATMKMAHFIEQKADEMIVEYSWKHKAKWYKLGVLANGDPHPMMAASEEHFIAQHYYGYSRYDAEKTFEYEVKHPSWNIYPVKKVVLDCDFSALYGGDFSFLQHADPTSVFLADGSDVVIMQKRNIYRSGAQ